MSTTPLGNQSSWNTAATPSSCWSKCCDDSGVSFRYSSTDSWGIETEWVFRDKNNQQAMFKEAKNRMMPSREAVLQFMARKRACCEDPWKMLWPRPHSAIQIRGFRTNEQPNRTALMRTVIGGWSRMRLRRNQRVCVDGLDEVWHRWSLRLKTARHYHKAKGDAMQKRLFLA